MFQSEQKTVAILETRSPPCRFADATFNATFNGGVNEEITLSSSSDYACFDASPCTNATVFPSASANEVAAKPSCPAFQIPTDDGASLGSQQGYPESPAIS